MRKMALCCMVILLLMMSAAAAQERKDEWQDKNTVFSQFKTIVIHTTIDQDLKIDEIECRKLEGLLDTAIWQAKLGRIRWLSESQLDKQLGALTQTDINLLKSSNPEAYAALVAEYGPKVVDGHLTIEVQQWGYSQLYVPEAWESYTKYCSMPVRVVKYDAKGKSTTTTQWEQVPVEAMRLVPAHYNQIAHAGLNFSLTSSRTGEKVWILLDLRDADGSKVPVEMTERILKRAADRLGALLR